MLQVKAPISKFIVYAYKDSTLLDNNVLKEKIENLVDLLKFRIEGKGIEDTAKSLQSELFDIRIDLVQHLLKNQDFLKTIQSVIIAEIAKKYYHKGRLKEISITVADALDVNLKILSSLGGLIEKHSTDILNTPTNLSLDDLKNPLVIPPSKEGKIIFNWLDASLNFEIALIAADLVLLNEISLSDKEIKSLTTFLKEVITDFGAYSVLINYWKPDVDDEEQLIRNIKIKAATLELENGMGLLFSNDSIRELIHE